jgi:hypothetical protein
MASDIETMTHIVVASVLAKTWDRRKGTLACSEEVPGRAVCSMEVSASVVRKDNCGRHCPR